MCEQLSVTSETQQASGSDHHPTVQSGQGKGQTTSGRSWGSMGRGKDLPFKLNTSFSLMLTCCDWFWLSFLLQIQQGMVVYVCFYHGATEDVTHEIGTSLCVYSHFHSHSTVDCHISMRGSGKKDESQGYISTLYVYSFVGMLAKKAESETGYSLALIVLICNRSLAIHFQF